MRKNVRRTKQTICGNRGESMLIVVVMLMVLLILGVSVLTAAGSTTAAASARIADRQVYYYARSVLDVVDESLCRDNGALGVALVKQAVDALIASGKSSVRPYHIQLETDDVTTDAPMKGMTIDPVTIDCSGWVETVAGKGGTLTKAYVSLRSVLLSVTVSYQEQTYTMRVRYRYSGNAQRKTISDEWSYQGTWSIEQVG